MPRLRPVLLALLLAAALPCMAAPRSASAQNSFGQGFTGSLVLNGRAVPLPPGEWRLLGRDSQPARGSALGVEAVLLVQEAGTRLAGVVVARASTPAVNAAYADFDRRGACARGDETIAVIVREATQAAQNCARVTQWSTPTRRPPAPAPEFAGYFALAESQGGWAPARFHSVWIAIADATGDLELYYHFSPETRGFVRDERPWPQNTWNPANQTSRHREHLARLTAWARSAHALARAGFASGSVGPLPPF